MGGVARDRQAFRARPMIPTFPRLPLATLALLGVAAVCEPGCHGSPATSRRDGDRATAEAEAKAQEATITSAEVSPTADAGATSGEMAAAFRLEQSDYRGRLQRALDQLDTAILRASRSRELRARRRVLKADLEAVDRGTEQDWATLRTKLERDLVPPDSP